MLSLCRRKIPSIIQYTAFHHLNPNVIRKRNSCMAISCRYFHKVSVAPDQMTDSIPLNSIEYWFENIDSVINILGLQHRIQQLSQSELQNFKQTLTFAFLTITNEHNKCVIQNNFGVGPRIQNYQCLEFLGDAILDYLLTKCLYKETTIASRMPFLSNEYFCKKFKESGLDTYIITSSPLQMKTYADILEAVIAAVYLSFGFKEAGRVAVHVFKLCSEDEALYQILQKNLEKRIIDF